MKKIIITYILLILTLSLSNAGAEESFGHTELIKAINAKDIVAVKKLIDAGADLDEADSTDFKITPLEHAIIDGVDWSLNMQNLLYELRPLKTPDIVKLLLDSGAMTTENSFYYAVLVRDIEALEMLLKASDKSEIFEKTERALDYAASNGNIEELKILLSAGADTGGYAIFVAAVQGRVDAVSLLLDAGANVNVRSPYNEMTPLMGAAENGFEWNMCQYLGLEKGIDSAQLMRGICSGSHIVSGLEIADDIINDARDFAEKRHFTILRALLKNGAEINAQDEYGQTALMKAAAIGDSETVKLLIESGADVDIIDSKGKNAITYAQEKGHDYVVKILKESGENK